MLAKKINCFIYLTLFLTIQAEADSLYRTVETENGLVRGILSKTLLKNIEYFAFKGIPYGKPPINDLRFKAPKPVLSWKPAVLDAFEYGNRCIRQTSTFVSDTSQSEDCLLLHIFVPADIDPSEKLAVMFFIHGGAYVTGSGDDLMSGPDFLIDQRVILVTVNYRLGPFGFLSLNSPEYSGNMGLKDQQLALKWVHKNIENFGGDRERITVFGISAGGTSTHFQMLSAESRKYFRNAIPMSGSAESYWAMSNVKNHLAMIYDLAEKVGEPKETYEDLVDFLKKVSPDVIFNHFPTYDFDATFDLVLAPVIERIDAVEPFITESPEEIYKTLETDINSLFGFTSHEYLISGAHNNPAIVQNLLNDFNLSLPFGNLDLIASSKEYRDMLKEIREFYFKNEIDPIDAYIDMTSDLNFAHFIQMSARKQAKVSSGNTFLYRFSVEAKLNVIKLIFKLNTAGTSHGDDICYLFRCGMLPAAYDAILSSKNDEESKLILKLIEDIAKFYTDFAKYGTLENYTKPIDSKKVHFVDITNDGFITGINPNQKRYEFWLHVEEKIKALRTKPSIEREEL